jgi:hypothetical protein
MRGLLSIYAFGAVLIASSVLPTDAFADARISCISRGYSKPSLETYKQRVLGSFSSRPELIAQYTASGDLEEIYQEYYQTFLPRDTFCILGESATASSLRPALETDGGNLYLLTPDSFTGDVVLASADLEADSSIAAALTEGVFRTRFPNPSVGCDHLMVGADGPEPRPSPQYNQCQRDMRNAIGRLREDLAVEEATFRLSEPGQVVNISYPAESNSAELGAIAITSFAADALSRELVMESIYDKSPSSTSLTLSSGFQGFSQPNSVAQWFASILEEAMRDASVSVASNVLALLSDADVEIVPTDLIREPVSIYDASVHLSEIRRLDSALSSFLCLSDYPRVISLTTRERFWFNLSAYDDTLCGERMGGEMIVFSSPASLRIDPVDIQVTERIRQIEDLALRLEEKLSELSSIQLDQSQLLNDIRETGYHNRFEAGLGDLRQKLRAAEEEARAQTVLEQEGKLGQFGTDVGKFMGAVGGLVGVWSGIPAASAASQSEYMWDNRKQLGEIGGQFGKSVAGIESGIREIEKWLDPSAEVDEVNRLKGAVAEMEAVYRQVLSDVSEKREEYRLGVDSVSREIYEIGLARHANQSAFASEAADIVALNLLAHTGAPGGRAAIEQCHRAIELIASEASEFNLQNLVAACLQISSQVGTRQSCVRDAQAGAGEQTYARAGTLAALIAVTAASECFD